MTAQFKASSMISLYFFGIFVALLSVNSTKFYCQIVKSVIFDVSIWDLTFKILSCTFFKKSLCQNFLLYVRLTLTFFTVLHGMQTRSSDEISVCPSVKHVDCDKTEEKSVPDFYTMQ